MKIIEEASLRNSGLPHELSVEVAGWQSPQTGVVEHPRLVSLDFKRLRRAGFLTPQTRKTRQAEEYRLVKRKLRERSKQWNGDPAVKNIFVVTSSRPREGKTFTSINLALTFALEEKCEVLLVDADVVRPSIFKTLAVPYCKEGLTDCLLESESYLNLASQVDGIPLKLLSSGRAVESASELFSGPRMLSWLHKLGSTNRIVILDTSPTLATNEPAVLSRLVGHTIFVVHATETSSGTIERSLDLLGHPKNLSLLLNKAFASGQLDQFGSYYESYSGKTY